MDGVEEGGVVGVEDCVGASFVVEVEGAEGRGGAEHGADDGGVRGGVMMMGGCDGWSGNS